MKALVLPILFKFMIALNILKSLYNIYVWYLSLYDVHVGVCMHNRVLSTGVCM